MKQTKPTTTKTTTTIKNITSVPLTPLLALWVGERWTVFPMEGENLPMALQQSKWERTKYFSLEAICLNSKEPDCAETENIFAFSQTGLFLS